MNDKAPQEDARSEPAERRNPTATSDGFPVVGIGASAGGLKALRELVEAMPDEPGVALVVIQHLDPTKKSLTPELLARSTRMRVTQVADDPHVKPNRVYVIPPDKYLGISGGELHLSEPDQPRGSRMAIDFFLRSLAKDQRQCAVGIILSGTGTDGTLGVKAIKAAAGLAIAQDPATADHEGMPRSAIETGVIDHVLSPGKITEVLVRYARHAYVREGPATAEREEEDRQELQSLNEELETVNNQLASKVEELETKHDDLNNLLQAAHLATICLDARLGIRWFSQEAAQLIRMTAADIGRPISDFAHEFLDGDDIAEVGRQVLERLEPKEREVRARGDRWYLRRTIPYRTADDRIGGLVITFIDITERKQAEIALREAHELAEKILDTVREATLVLDSELRVVRANDSFYRTFEVSRDETEGRQLYELGNGQWDVTELRLLLEEVLPDNNVFNDYEVDHEFESIGRRVMLLNGRQIDHIQMILLAIEDITELRLAERRRGFLLELNDTFRHNEDLQVILQEATSRLCDFLNCGRTLFLAVSSRGSRKQAGVLAQRSNGHDDLPEEFPLAGLGPEALAPLERDEELVVDDLFQDPRFKGTAPNIFADMDLRALVAVPRLDGGRLQSLLLVGRSHRRRWNREEVSLIRDVSDRTCAAMQAVYAERALSESEKRFRTIFDTAAVGMAQVAPEGRFLNVNAAFCEMLGYEEAEITELTYGDITHEEDIGTIEAQVQRLRAGEADTFTLEERNRRKDGSTYWVNLTVSAIRHPSGKLHYFVSIMEDIDRRKEAEAELKRLNVSLEEQVRERTEMLSILQDVTRSANEARTVEEAMRRALERIAEYNGWQVGHVWQQAHDGTGQMVSSGIWYFTDQAERAVGRLEEFRKICQETRFSAGEGMVGAVMESAKPKWIDDIKHFDDWQRDRAERLGLHAAIGFPVTVNGEVVAVLEFFSGHPTRREARFMEIMPDVGIQLGHVIERKRLERGIAEATAEQQRRFGRELHDSVSQELTGIRILAESLREDLANAGLPYSDRVETLVDHLQKAHGQLRRLARGLLPVEVDAEGLMNALGTLAEDTAQMAGIECEFRCLRRVTVENNNVATHLYRIAQEAIQNAMRHGQTSRIVIDLTMEDNHLTLRIEDDGGGLQPVPSPSRGVGLRLMQYRADLIGARLEVQSREGEGVTVICEIPLR